MRHSDEWIVDFRLAVSDSGKGFPPLRLLDCWSRSDALLRMMGLLLLSSMDVNAFEIIGIDAAL